MINLKTPLTEATDRERWAARGASFVTKVKATKMVWFPPGPGDASGKAASTAKKATKQAGGTASKTAKKTTGTAKKKTSGATKRATGAAKKSGATAKGVTKKATGSGSKGG